MNFQELETAKRLGLAIVNIVWTDNAYGVIEMHQGRKFGRLAGTKFDNPDWVALAESFGLAGLRVESAGQVTPVLRRALELERHARAEGQEVLWLAVGRKGASTLRFRRYELTGQWAGFADQPTYHDAQAVGHRLAELYEAEEVDRVVLVYNRFESALVQRVTTTDLLPIREEVLAGDESAGEDDREGGVSGDFIYEPEPEEILARLLPVYVETELYRALLESAASEQGARMTAMRNASKAAQELIDSLTLAMNRARQAEITQEILEVVAGADALSG
jgi:F-type H+-transporting ATPase subunit gamma